MKCALCLLSMLWLKLLPAQEPSLPLQQQVEDLTVKEEVEPEQDEWVLDMENLLQNPVRLQTTDAASLRRIPWLNEMQVQSYLRYRSFFGNPENIYELQAIPGWTPALIRQVLPYLDLQAGEGKPDPIGVRSKWGLHQLLMRGSGVLPRARGYLSGKYPGSSIKFFSRYRYQYKNLLQWGFTLEKDAGERLFLHGKPLRGFDFMSGHLQLNKWKAIESLVLGDFTVNFAQGLIQWQAFSFGKGAEISQLPRRANPFRAYTSPGESRFMRGAALSLRRGNWQAGGFVSFRKRDANTKLDERRNRWVISSLQESGLHRTEAEMADRHTAHLFSTGIFLRRERGGGGLGTQAVFHHLDKFFLRTPAPYNLFYFSGTTGFNLSMDYHFTFRNLHGFGEGAVDGKGDLALVNGLLISLDKRVDAGLVLRVLARDYTALTGNAFTESTSPQNEQGLYVSVTARPAPAWKLDAFMDVYHFPWLRYQVNRSSRGSDLQLQALFQPGRRFSLSGRLRYRVKEANETGGEVIYPLGCHRQLNFRCHVNLQFSSGIQLRGRMERVGTSPRREEGFLVFADLFARPPGKRWGGSFRICLFETDSYDSRIYAYENTVLYGFGVPAFYGRGIRYYVNAEWDISSGLKGWLRWAGTRHPGRAGIGTGNDQVAGPTRSEWMVQLRWQASHK